MERYIAFDIGDKRIGVAVSDPFNTYALPSFTYHRKNFKEDIAELVRIAAEKGATAIICGLPVNFDGTEAVQTVKARRFIDALKEATALPVICEDERLTTQMAHETLISEGMRREKRKNYVDALAAANILDGYLGRIKKDSKGADAMEKDKTIPEEQENLSPEEEQDDIIELIDDDDNVIKFKLMDVTEYKGEKYALLLAAEPNEAVGDDEVAIFRYKEEEGMLEPIEDDALLDEVWEFYQSEEDEEQ